MNLQFLGDALDHWKGSVFEQLQNSLLLRDFKVDPMASDSEAWGQIDQRLYARLLGIQQHQLVTHENTLYGNRSKYFNEIPVMGDLFLDPDTGFKTGKVKRLPQYLQPEELFSLLEQENFRIVAVYQHVRAKRTRDRVEEVLGALRPVSGDFFCTSYESGTVALLFFSLVPERIEAIKNHFRLLLDKHADNRVGYWNET